MSIGGGKSSSKQTSSSTANSTANSQNFGSDVWGPQSPFLQNLYGQASNLQNQLQGPSGAEPWLAGAQGALGQMNQGLQQSSQALGQFLNPGMDPSVNAYATNLGQNFREQFLPELQGQAALAGGLGGSRQQIGAALGAQRAMQTLGDFTAQTYAGQQDRALAAAQGLGQNALGYQNAGQLGLAGADFARSMPWYNLSQYQGLLGAPIMQDKGGWSTSSSTSTSQGKGGSSGFNFNAGLGGG